MATPRRPVNAYNYYAIEMRNTLQPVRTNNEWNQEVGQMWRALGSAQREPYEALAALDRLRYAEECAAAGVSSTVKKLMTAYNIFVREEKQFLEGIDVHNVKAMLGRHCSQRWASMSDQERAMYQALADHAAQQALASAVNLRVSGTDGQRQR